MDVLYRLSIHPSYSFEHAWNVLETIGVEILYGSEEEGRSEIFAHLSSPHALSSLHWITSCDPYTLPSIDWETQWATHSHYFHDGYLQIDLSSLQRSGPLLRLQPGSGFGDLSHPTTRLMMEMLAKYLDTQIAIDIGCGSGILSLAAVAMGAPTAYGIDIDTQALEHSQQNALINKLEAQCRFFLPSELNWHSTSHPVLILMNMIRTEQLAAWSSLDVLHSQPAEILTSGIRQEERHLYLDQMNEYGWTLQDEKEEAGWLVFYFTNKNNSP